MNRWQHGKQDDSDEGRRKKMNSKRPGIVSGRLLRGIFIGGVNWSAPWLRVHARTPIGHFQGCEGER